MLVPQDENIALHSSLGSIPSLGTNIINVALKPSQYLYNIAIENFHPEKNIVNRGVAEVDNDFRGVKISLLPSTTCNIYFVILNVIKITNRFVCCI